MKTLFILYFRGLWRNLQKGALFAKMYLLVIWWVFIAGACFGASYFELDRLIALLSPLIVAIVPALAFLPDIIFRFFTTRESANMDSFLRTRPVKEETWEYFLWLSQFVDPENLFLPALILPFALFVMPIGWGLCLLLALYFVSVFDAIVVMELRRGTPYNENVKQTKSEGESWLERLFNRFSIKSMQGAVFGIQSRSFLRSKRLKLSVLIMGVYFVFYAYFTLLQEPPSFMLEDGEYTPNTTMVFFAIFMPSLLLSQFGLGIEANFFNGIWTRPFVLRRVLDDKFRFYNLLTLIFSAMFIPACCMGKMSWFILLGDVIYTVGIGNIYCLWPCFNCQPFDLMGKAFFNTQGTKSTFNVKLIILMFVFILVIVPLSFFLPAFWFFVICSTAGIIGLIFRRRFFDYLIRDFEKNKYKYMERYNK